MIPKGHRDRASRARQRGNWPVTVARLGDEPAEDLSTLTTPEQRLEMMWPLALEAWALAGFDLPSYARADTPIKVLTPARGDRGRGQS